MTVTRRLFPKSETFNVHFQNDFITMWSKSEVERVTYCQPLDYLRISSL